MDENTRLALIRTLLATERNYLAVERTQLSQLRSDLSLALVAPSAAAALAYIFSYIPETFNVEILSYIVLTILTVYGTYMSFSAYGRLKKTREVQRMVRKREIEVIEESELLRSYLKDILISDKSWTHFKKT